MSAVLVPAPTAGTAYLSESFGSGSSVARVAAELLQDRPLEPFVVVPEAAGSRPPSTFGRGLGVTAAPVFECLARELIERYPSSRLVVTLPLAAPGDAMLATAPGAVAACGAEVSVVVDLAAGAGTVEEALRMADPSFSYCAVVVDSDDSTLATSCPVDQLRDGGYRLRAVISGAYDGEGFVLGVL